LTDWDTGIAGVRVRRVDTISEALEGGTRVGPYSTARPGALLRSVPGIGRFLVRDGNTIEYCAEGGADESALESVLQGAALGALIHQRGELPLHATTIVSPDGRSAIALAGDSGAGKSTTAYQLILLGWSLLTDDLTRLTIQEGLACAWPGRSRLRLVSDACERFGLDPAGLAAAPNWPGKYVLQLPCWRTPAPLLALVVLNKGGGPFAIEPVTGAAAGRLLAEQTYRPHYVAALGQQRRHFELTSGAAASTAVFRCSGRSDVETMAESIASATRGLTGTGPHENRAPTLDERKTE
jgi:hypothetical protein